MVTRTLKIIPIGNSHGVRIPKSTLEAYHFGNEIVCEELPEGLLLRHHKNQKLSLEDTFKEMAQADEDWSDLDAIDNDFSDIQ